jgi:hypothetical protein
MRVNAFLATTGHGLARASRSANDAWSVEWLLTDPGAPGQVYAGLATGEVWHSTTHGDIWRQLNVSLGRMHRTLLLLP